MSIFDEVKRSISSTGKQVAKRTKEISDAVSIRSQINEEKENVAKLYATVGKKVFQNATEADEEKFFMEFHLHPQQPGEKERAGRTSHRNGRMHLLL